ncbi:MAG: transglutaminase domain-containing protein [Oligoflexia bacterium]|nr:transglutaminase domain-containing protein [Oligoflexia bacterium]
MKIITKQINFFHPLFFSFFTTILFISLLVSLYISTLLLSSTTSFAATPTLKTEVTLHEGTKLYNAHWNFWIRVGGEITTPDNTFFKDYEQSHPFITKMISDIGAGTATARTEEETWIKVKKVWNFLSQKVQINNQEYSKLIVNGGWPSLLQFATYYQAHNNLVWAACFSKAHLFASLLGRVGIPRWRITMANAHHTEGGAPATATHVFVALYIGGKWLYLDPTWVYSRPNLPEFENKISIGNFQSVDYKHPYSVLPIPLSGLNLVPLLN